MDFLPARHFTKGRKVPVTLVVIHTTENSEKPGTARAVAQWFASDQSPQASAHYILDTEGVIQSVKDEDTAWACGVENNRSVSIEMVGRAEQKSSDWWDNFSNLELMIAAMLTARLCHKFSVPAVKLTPEQVKAQESGICGHVDITKGYKVQGGHWDPGPWFPWGEFIGMVDTELKKLNEVDAQERDTAVDVNRGG